MVLESIVSPEAAKRHPYAIVFLSILFVSITMVLVQYLGFMNGFFTVALVSVPSVALVLNLIRQEEFEQEEKRVFGSVLVARYFDVVLVLVAFFIGLIIAFTFWYLFLPNSVSNQVFSSQIQEIKSVGASVSGFSIKMDFQTAFESLFIHNLVVLSIILFLSILYGAGSVLILVWNASVISVFLGEFAKGVVMKVPGEYSLLSGLSYGVLGILPHGTFELLAYLIATLAGGILSSALVSRAYARGHFVLILRDVAKLCAWSIVCLAVGALIESGAFLY